MTISHLFVGVECNYILHLMPFRISNVLLCSSNSVVRQSAELFT
jgi:hypothetical protein